MPAAEPPPRSNSHRRISTGSSGKKAEDLSEQELDRATGDLGIEEQAITDQDVAAIEQAPHPAEPSYIGELERLAGLRDDGIITEEEFRAKKKQFPGL